MKKLKLTFLLTTFLALTFSCSSDDDANSGPATLAGTWIGTAVDYSGSSITTATATGETTSEATFFGDGFDINNTLIFSEDPNTIDASGVYSVNLDYNFNGVITTETIENIDFLGAGTWTRSGDTVTITEDGESSTATIETLTSSTLVLSITESEIDTNPTFETETEISVIITFARQ